MCDSIVIVVIITVAVCATLLYSSCPCHL
jgi:hypothetical protein